MEFIWKPTKISLRDHENYRNPSSQNLSLDLLRAILFVVITPIIIYHKLERYDRAIDAHVLVLKPPGTINILYRAENENFISPHLHLYNLIGA